MPTYRTATEDETVALGERLARELPRRGVVLLMGNLGAGKTTLAKGIVSGLAAAGPDDVTSPTFTLIHEYGGGRVYHVDLYRLDDPRQVANLGLDDLIEDGPGAHRVGRALSPTHARPPDRDRHPRPGKRRKRNRGHRTT